MMGVLRRLRQLVRRSRKTADRRHKGDLVPHPDAQEYIRPVAPPAPSPPHGPIHVAGQHDVTIDRAPHVSQNARHIGDSLHSNGLALLRENQDAPLEQFTDLSDIDHQQQVAWSRLITTFDETLSVVRPALGLVPEIGANLETGVNILKKIFAASHRIGDLHAHAMEAAQYAAQVYLVLHDAANQPNQPSWLLSQAEDFRLQTEMLQRVIESYIHANKAKALLSATRYNERIDRAVATLKRNLALHASQRAGAMEALFRSIDQGLSEDRRQVTNFWRASLANAVNGGIQDFGGSEQGGAAQLTPMDMQGQIEALRRQSAANFASLSAKIDTLSGNLATLCEGLRIDLASHQRTPLGSMPPVSVVPETRIMVARWRDVMQDGTYAINKNPLLRDIANLADYAHYKSSYLKLLSTRAHSARETSDLSTVIESRTDTPSITTSASSSQSDVIAELADGERATFLAYSVYTADTDKDTSD